MSRHRRFALWQRAQEKTIDDHIPRGGAVLSLAIQWVEWPVGWPAVLRHNLHVGAMLTSLADACEV